MTKLKKKTNKKNRITGHALTCIYSFSAFIDIALLGVFTPPLSRLALTAKTDK